MPARSKPRPSSPPPRTPSGREILDRYAGLPFTARLFLRLRWLWTPYLEMASLLPLRGKILDGGCGHGLLSLTLALQSPQRRVLGLDHSPARVEAAKKAGGDLKNLSFQTGDYTAPPSGPFDAVALIDCLHYLTWENQARAMKTVHQRLRKGGTFLFREVDRSPGPASLFNQCHESIMTGLGITKAGGLHFRGGPEWVKLAEDSGFTVQSKPTKRFPFADVMYWGVKK